MELVKEDWISFNKGIPVNGQVIFLKQNDIVIKAETKIFNDEISFTWLPNEHEKGICLITKPTHWQPFK